MYDSELFSTRNSSPHTIIGNKSKGIPKFGVEDPWSWNKRFQKVDRHQKNDALTPTTVALGFRASATSFAS